MPETYLFQELDRRIQDLERRTEDLPAIRANANSLTVVVQALGDEVKALRRAIITAAVSFAGSALILAISVLIALR